MSDNLVYALGECVAYVDGVRVVTHQNEPWNAKDPIVKKRPDLFSDNPVTTRGTVEQATAEPGEKRNTRRGTRSSADTDA